MDRRRQISFLLLALLGAILALSGCPLKFEKAAYENVPPICFFDVPRSVVPDTTFQNQRFFRAIGTDEDSDIVAYQYQLVQTTANYYFTGVDPGDESHILDYVLPPENSWSERRTENFVNVTDLDDGFYEMRYRSIDDEGAFSKPARKRFFVFFDDIAPEVTITNNPLCGRLNPPGTTSYLFQFTATDDSRESMTPRSALRWRVQLRAQEPRSNCASHLSDPWTDLKYFPNDSASPVFVGSEPPTIYNDLLRSGANACTWEFKVEVTDPAGNTGATSCIIEQPRN